MSTAEIPVNAKLFGPSFPDAAVVAAAPVADGSALPRSPLAARATAAGAVAGLPPVLELFAALGWGNAIAKNTWSGVTAALFDDTRTVQLPGGGQEKRS